MDQAARPRWQIVAVAFVALAALAYASIATMLPPAAAPANAAPERFSAGRAFEQVSRIGERVHPVGSKALFAVRADIEGYLRWLGLRVEVQAAVGATEAFGRGAAMARVHNVIATMPGTDPTGRVVLVAHYDSAEVSHGANDDGAGVATLLETARAMMFGTRPRNDVVFLFTDAEEACLCGAEAFVSQHPYGADGGVALNFEARGSVGPVIMFETTEGNAGVVSAYAAAAEHPVATSFAVEVYRILPNDTDFTPMRTSGRFTGLNAAYIDGSTVYHSPDDVPATMDRGALQQHGDNALALTRALAAADLTTVAQPSDGDLTYFPVLGTLARYPGSLVWPFAALAALAVVGLAALARRRRRPHLGAPELGRGVTTWPRVLGGFGAATVPLLLTPPAAQGLWSLLVAIRPDYADLIDPWRPGWYRAAVLALVATILLLWYGLLRRRLGGWALALGGLLWLAVLGCVLAALTPGGSYLAAIPALSVAAGLAVSLITRRAWLVLLVVWLGVAGAVLVLAPTIALFFPALGLATAAAPALFALLLGFAVLPLVAYLYPSPHPASADEGSALWEFALPQQGFRHALPAVVAGVLTVAFAGYGLLTDPVGEHSRPAQLAYALDTGTGEAWWVSRTDPNPWTAQYVTGRADLSAQFPMLIGEQWTGPAKVADLAAPTVEVLADETSGTTRTLDIVVKPHRESRAVHLRLSGAPVITASADGRDVPAAALEGDTFDLLFFAPPRDGLTVRLQVSGTAPLQLRLTDASIGLDGLPGFVPRPPGIGVAAGHDAELVLVARTYDL